MSNNLLNTKVHHDYPLIKIKGFRNLGNTCYMNAALQALLSSNIINSRIITYTLKNMDKVSEYSPMLYEYMKILFSLIKPDDVYYCDAKVEAVDLMKSLDTESYVAPRIFKDVLSKENKTFAGYNQQDSHELISFLLNNFTELPGFDNKKIELKDKKNGIRKILHDTYFGTYRQILHCKECNHKNVKIDNHMDIILPVPIARPRVRSHTHTHTHTRAKEMVTIEDCFNKYSETEMFLEKNNKLHCDKCKKKTITTKKMELEYVPEVTILTLNRFDGLRKLDNKIELFHRMELDGYNLILVSTVNHIGGTVHSGHYTSYASRLYYDNNTIKQKWFYADDSSIRETTLENVLNDPRIYLAIYERVPQKQ